MRTRKMLLASLLLSIALFATGCFATSISMNFTPNPVELKPGDSKIAGKLSVKLTGFGTIKITDIVATPRDSDNQPILDDALTKISVNKTVPAFGVGTTESVDVPITYDEAKAAGLDNILIQVNGSRPSSLVVKIKLAPEV